MKLSQFEPLEKEAIRQFTEIRDSLQNSKNIAQVLLGFTIGFLSLYFIVSEINKIEFFDFIYIIEIISAGIFGFMAYYIRNYSLGIDLNQAFSLSKVNPKISTRLHVFNYIVDANKTNKKELLKKNKWLKAGYITYGFGIISFIIVKLINLSALS